MVNYELLRTFAAVVAAGSHAEAARRRHVSVSAISQQLKALEVQLGVTLFERIGRRAVPTVAARALAQQLRAPLETLEATVEALRDEHSGVRGEVALGAPRAFARTFLRPRLAALLRQQPGLTVRLELGVPSVLEAALLSGRIDLAVLGRAPESDLLLGGPLHTETFVLVGAPAYLDKAGRPRDLEALVLHPFIVFDGDRAMHRPWWRATFGRRTPDRAQVRAAVPDLDEMAAWVEAGLGLAVLPDYVVASRIKAGELEVLRPRRRGVAPRPARSALHWVERRHVAATPKRTALKQALLGPPPR